MKSDGLREPLPGLQIPGRVRGSGKRLEVQMTEGNECSTRNDLKQFRYVRMHRYSYDAYMSFNFLSSEFGTCHAKLWATGRYGFTLPKKVEITVPGGATFVYHYYNRKAGLKSELTNQLIVRIAIARFLDRAGQEPGVPVEIDEGTPPFEGALAQVRASKRPVSMRVRPGVLYGRGGATNSGGGAGQPGVATGEQPVAGP